MHLLNIIEMKIAIEKLIFQLKNTTLLF